MRKTVDNVNLKSLITFLMSFALPCALFGTIAHTQYAALFGQSRLVLVLAIVYLLTYGGVFLATRLDSSSDKSVVALTLAFPNATAVGLPLLAAAYGAPGSVACASAIAVGAVTISPITLAILESLSGPTHASFMNGLRIALWRAVKRPVVWAPVLAIFVVLLRFSLPTYVDRTVMIFAGATAGVALFLTGLVVYVGGGRGGSHEEHSAASTLPWGSDAVSFAGGCDALCRADLRDSVWVLWDCVREGIRGDAGGC